MRWGSHDAQQKPRAHLDGRVVDACRAIRREGWLEDSGLRCYHIGTVCSHQEAEKPWAGTSEVAAQVTAMLSVPVGIAVLAGSQAIRDSWRTADSAPRSSAVVLVHRHTGLAVGQTVEAQTLDSVEVVQGRTLRYLYVVHLAAVAR